MARSRAYPVIALPEAVKGIEAIAREVGKGRHSRDAMARALGYKSGVGLAARKVAALVQYGLLERAPGGHYEPTELAEALLHPRTDAEYRDMLTRAFETPQLFAGLVSRYRHEKRIPNQLANILIRDHGITRDASESAAMSFFESARFAKVIDDQNCFVDVGAADEHYDEGDNVIASDDVIDEGELDGSRARAGAKGHPAVRVPVPKGYRSYPLGLRSGEAQLVVPTPLSAADITKLRQGVDLILKLLELDVGNEDSSSV